METQRERESASGQKRERERERNNKIRYLDHPRVVASTSFPIEKQRKKERKNEMIKRERHLA